jgi:hypothetical protein
MRQPSQLSSRTEREGAPSDRDAAQPARAEQLPRSPGLLRRAWRWLVLPAAVYFVAFSVMTFPAILSFGSRFFCDGGDGLQNVWNIWWVRKAIVDLHQSPWHTAWLHFPNGTTLLGQTLNPFNGLMGIPLSWVMSPVAVHNSAVLLGFVGGGWTAFLLTHDATESYWPSLVAGFAFTFSGYHFAHAEGHLQLVSLQWVPLFVLSWIRLLRFPTMARGLLSAIALGLVILCDYYYFGYCVAIALIIAAYRAAEQRDALMLLRTRYRLPAGAFAVASALTSGLLVGALLWHASVDPFSGSHPPGAYSTDLLAPFIPGGHSAYRSLTEWYWGHLRGNIHESSVYVGLVVLALAGWGIARWRDAWVRDAPLWLLIGLVFFALSLGPALTYRGRSLTGPWMPYRWLELAIPPLKLSGCPVRMMMPVSLALSVLAGTGLAAVLRRRTPWRLAIAALLTAGIVAELWPRPMTLFQPDVPGWVHFLRDQPGGGGLLDLSGRDASLALYYQTIHEKPMAFGYVSRASRSVLAAQARLASDIQSGHFLTIRDRYGFRYVLTDTVGQPPPGLLYEGEGVRVLDMTKARLSD